MFVHRNWGEDALYFRGEDGRLWSINRALTDRKDPDPFVTFSGGRAACRTADLVELADLVAELGRTLGPVDVQETSPSGSKKLRRRSP
mgnify:CR=1 FL=1